VGGAPEVHRSASDYAYDRLREELLAGRLRAGASIVEGEWAERLGLSVTPVREALRRLEAQGLVVRRRHRDVRVRSFSGAEAQSLYEFRAILESTAAGLAATRVDAAMAERLHVLIAQQEEAWRAGAPIELHNNAFHVALGEFSGNPFLAYALSDVWLMVPVLRAAAWSRFADRPGESVEEHRAIADAILSGDPTEATRRGREHAVSAWRRLRQALAFQSVDEARPSSRHDEADALEARWRALEAMMTATPPLGEEPGPGLA
jgi:DNA-binding GntR family transcriptional regulator